jgi:gamma-glutamylputrescine oxidase
VGDPLNNSYYAATANSFESKPHTDAAYDVDVVVVGGGFTGLSAALACAEKGYSVTLLEAKIIGFGASGRNGGQLIPGLRWSMTEIDAAFGRERAKAIFDLAWSARDRVWGRVARHGIDCDLKSGHFEAAYKPKHFDEMRREAAFLSSQFGYETETVSPAHLSDHINGGGYHGGIYDRQGGHFHPLNYVLGLAKAAQDAGVTLIENARVLGILDIGEVEAFWSGATIKAKFAIIATDSWIGDIAPDLGCYTVPILNYNIATAPLPDADALLPSDAAVADSRFVLNYFRLSADKRLIFGGGEKYTTRIPADIAGFVRRHMVEVFPSLAQAPVDYAWGGAVAVTMNRLPHFGRHGNRFYAHGFSGHGALMTTLAGELIAEAMCGTAERFDVFANLPHRAFPGGRWLRQPLATAGLLWYALRDRL